MSVYNNTSKIYPDLNLTAPHNNEAYLLDEIEVRERLAKKMKRLNTITSIVNTVLITSTIITGGVFIAVFTSGVVLCLFVLR